MRLLTKNSIVLLAVILLVFTVGGVIFYYQLQTIMHEEATEALHIKKTEVEEYVLKNKRLPETILSEDLFSFSESADLPAERLSDTVLYVKAEDEHMPYKQLHFGIQLNGKYYSCVVSKSLLESDDMIETIFKSFVWILILAVALFTVINYFFFKRTWKPFFTTLNLINNYKLEQHKELDLPNTNTREFAEMNKAIKKMTAKISDDFNNLKSFTENASHELQTPLAIITNKSELLLQTEGLTEKQAAEIIEINNTARRLGKLNEVLLLLSKIENNQFNYNGATDISTIVSKKTEHFNELAEMKGIKTVIELKAVTVPIHPVLADAVVSNLLSNAVKYTGQHGIITINLNENRLEIFNTGEPMTLNPEDVFKRFYKGSEESSSTGLGLALVKQIAMANQHRVEYVYENLNHCFRYIFK